MPSNVWNWYTRLFEPTKFNLQGQWRASLQSCRVVPGRNAQDLLIIFGLPFTVCWLKFTPFQSEQVAAMWPLAAPSLLLKFFFVLRSTKDPVKILTFLIALRNRTHWLTRWAHVKVLLFYYSVGSNVQFWGRQRWKCTTFSFKHLAGPNSLLFHSCVSVFILPRSLGYKIWKFISEMILLRIFLFLIFLHFLLSQSHHHWAACRWNGWYPEIQFCTGIQSDSIHWLAAGFKEVSAKRWKIKLLIWWIMHF